MVRWPALVDLVLQVCPPTWVHPAMRPSRSVSSERRGFAVIVLAALVAVVGATTECMLECGGLSDTLNVNFMSVRAVLLHRTSFWT
jgi:hypothetical protein